MLPSLCVRKQHREREYHKISFLLKRESNVNMKIYSLASFKILLIFFFAIADGTSKFLEAEKEINSHYYNHHHDGRITWNYGRKGRNSNGNSDNSDRNKCQDNSPYCARFVEAYGLEPPFTVCDEDWFTNADGIYGCRKACALC